MTQQYAASVVSQPVRLDPGTYDRSPSLTDDEREGLAALAGGQHHVSSTRATDAARSKAIRVLTPIDDALLTIGVALGRQRSRLTLVRAMHERDLAFWGWSHRQWLDTLHTTDGDFRQLVIAVAYLLVDRRDLHSAFPGTNRRLLACRVFGISAVEESTGRVLSHLEHRGYGPTLGGPALRGALYELMLQTGSPRLEDLCVDARALVQLRSGAHALRWGIRQLATALAGMGVLTASPFPAQVAPEEWLTRATASQVNVHSDWLTWSQRWLLTSPLSKKARESTYYCLLKCGRWLADRHSHATTPGQWDRQLAAQWVAAVDRMLVGEWAHAPSTFRYKHRVGQPMSARSKDQHIGYLRRFFQDCQEWEWIPRRFDPARALRTPRSITNLIGPDPRVIADDVWAKLMWAGLNLEPSDLPQHAGPHGGPWYPLPMVRAVAILWLFAGLRVGEIGRLPVGCIRWQSADIEARTADGDEQLVCLLDVPTNKSGTSFTKPVDRTVGEAVDAWEAVRPQQPRFTDLKTGHAVDMLFAYRGSLLSPKYVNRILIPMLCRKANVPREDARGRITSHRARSTIATQLYNAKDPMTLFELQAWLGHRSPETTQHYARITPTTLARAYTDAGYFARNVRTIEVLVDRDAVQNGAAASGEPWQFFDLGHGYCTYSFFEQCPHRMACARCDFYVPKPSTQADLVEAKSNLQRMLAQIPLTDDERAAVEDGQAAVDQLLGRLADIRTPAGPTPRALGMPPLAVTLPLRPAKDPALPASDSV